MLFQDKFTNNNNNNYETVPDESKTGWFSNSFWSWWQWNKILPLARIEPKSYSSSVQLRWNIQPNFILDMTNSMFSSYWLLRTTPPEVHQSPTRAFKPTFRSLPTITSSFSAKQVSTLRWWRVSGFYHHLATTEIDCIHTSAFFNKIPRGRNIVAGTHDTTFFFPPTIKLLLPLLCALLSASVLIF
jgi:hypothetical protein